MMDDEEALNPSPEEQDLLLRLAALPQEAEPARDLWPGIAARIAPARPAPRARRHLRTFARAAAALLLFASGVAVGHNWGRPAEPAHPARPAQTVRDPLAPAVEVQRTGTAYVAALRTLAEAPSTPAAQAQGREAALSVLYGAAHELVRLNPQDPGAHQILNTVSTRRSVRTVRF